MKLNLWSAFLIIIFTSSAIAQQRGHKSTSAWEICHSTEYQDTLALRFPSSFDEENFEQTLQKQISRKGLLRSEEETVYRVPVIVHVINNGEAVGVGSNISAKQVASQIVAMNDDFRKRGLGYNDHESGADTKIEFYLATRDIYGNLLPEPGIDRVTFQRNWTNKSLEEILKPATYWNPSRYLNIWTVDFRDLLGFAAYAQFPINSGLEGLDEELPAYTDGVLVNYRYFGTVESATEPYNLGRITTHEVGHWLGLRHIWGDGNCDKDDFCEDTPPAEAANRICVENISCDSRDMIENYMDYTPDACKNIFTQNQKARMRTVLEVSPRRKELLNQKDYCESVTELQSFGNQTTTSLPAFYHYKADKDEILTLSSIGKTNEDTYVKIMRSCDEVAFASNDDLGNTLQSGLNLSLAQDEEIIIYWDNLQSNEHFTWTMSSANPAEGLTCDNPSLAIQGENVPINYEQLLWYKWVQTEENKRLTIKAQGSTIDILSGNCATFTSLASGSDSLTYFDLNQNDTCFILLSGNIPNKWELEMEDLLPGQSCKLSQVATNGSNSFSGAYSWYTFTTPVSGDYIFVTSDASYNELSIFRECGAEPIATTDRNAYRLGDAGKNETYLLRWEDIENQEGFEWSMSYHEDKIGENCHSAFIAKAGENIHKMEDDLFQVWYRFITPDYPSIITFDFGQQQASDGFDLYRGSDCNNLEWIYNIAPYPWNDSPILDPQDTIYIVWEPEEDTIFNWTINVNPAIAGDLCETPLISTEGMNKSQRAYMNCWTSFTMPRSGDFTISSVGHTDLDTELEWYNSCDGTIIRSNDDVNDTHQSALSFTGVSAGEEFLFHWNNQFDNLPIEWEITIEENKTSGAVCSNPIPLNFGETTYSGKSGNWYEITIPEDGDLFISSENLATVDTYILIYEDCDLELIAENDDVDPFLLILQSEVIVPDRVAGEILLVYWSNKWNESEFDWKMKILDEEIPFIVEDQTFTVSELSEIGAFIGNVSIESTPSADLTFSISSGNDNYTFSINENTGEISLDQSLDFETQNEYTLIVSVSNQTETVTAQIIITVLDELELGVLNRESIKFYPNPASDHITIENLNDNITEIRILDMVGKLVVSHTTTKTTRISVSDLPSGVYFIEFRHNQQIQRQKLILK